MQRASCDGNRVQSYNMQTKLTGPEQGIPVAAPGRSAMAAHRAHRGKTRSAFPHRAAGFLRLTWVSQGDAACGEKT